MTDGPAEKPCEYKFVLPGFLLLRLDKQVPQSERRKFVVDAVFDALDRHERGRQATAAAMKGVDKAE